MVGGQVGGCVVMVIGLVLLDMTGFEAFYRLFAGCLQPC